MAEFKVLKIDNSKNAAIRSGKWSNPGAKFYDQLLNAVYSNSADLPAGPTEMEEAIRKGTYGNWDVLLKEAYLVAPVKDIKNSPHGVTPFSRSGCKYPHHVIKGNKLVLSMPGLRSAFITARNQGVFVNHTQENKMIVAHLNRHCKELGVKPVWHHGDFYLMEESDIKIEENFHDISLYIMEKTGINLFEDDIPSIRSTDHYNSQEFDESVIEGPPEKPVLTHDFDKEVGDTTPQALWKWMHENIEYDKEPNWHLKSPAEFYMAKKGNCHDQSYFASFILHSWHYDNWQLFFVEFKDGSDIGGNTHTLTCYVDKDGQYYWFENAWEDQAGIHGPYNYKEDVKNAVVDAYLHDYDLNSHEFDGIVFGEHPNYRLGMNLWDYCKSWHLEEEERRFDKKKDYDPPLAYDKLPQHLKNDPVHAWRAKTGIELIHKEPSLDELHRIWNNWQLMSDDMKVQSDKKSIELFGVDNRTHYHQLLSEYQETKNSINEAMNWIEQFVHDDEFRESAVGSGPSKELTQEEIKELDKKNDEDLVPIYGIIKSYSHEKLRNDGSMKSDSELNSIKFDKIIHALTRGDNYSHALVSFDDTLTHMYSFEDEGFVEDNIETKLSWMGTKSIYICVMFVRESDKKRMESFVKNLKKHQKETAYASVNLLKAFVGKPIKNDKRFVCSSFTGFILSCSNPKNLHRDYSRLRPEDITILPRSFYLMNVRDAADFKEKHQEIKDKVKAIFDEYRDEIEDYNNHLPRLLLQDRVDKLKTLDKILDWIIYKM